MQSDRLQRIIQLKERLLEEKEQVLDQYKRKRSVIESNISKLDDEINANYSDLCTRCLDGSEFALLRDYLEHLGRLKTEALNQKELVGDKIAGLRAELLEMLRKIKVLDALKDKVISAARGVENKKYQKVLDDIALRLESRKN